MKTIEELKKLDDKDVLAISAEEGNFLMSLVQSMKPKVIVEVGTGHGYSTSWMENGLYMGGKIWTIDDLKLAHLFNGDGSVEFLNGKLHNLMDLVPKKIDLVFLDSQHTIDDIVRDIEKLSPRMKAGGMIVVHDTEYCDEMGRCLKDYFNGKDTERLRSVGVKPSTEKWYYSSKKTKYGLGLAIKGEAK